MPSKSDNGETARGLEKPRSKHEERAAAAAGETYKPILLSQLTHH